MDMVFCEQMTKESEVSKSLGVNRSELKTIRKSVPSVHPELGVLWGREESKKPEHLQTVMWTDNGLLFLRHYIEVKKQWAEMEKAIEKPEADSLKPMTKGDFDKVVNNTKWAGKVVNNSYKNLRTVMVEHDIGFKVLVNCRDNRLLPKLGWVVVDSKNLRHTIRLPYFKSHEKAQQACKK